MVLQSMTTVIVMASLICVTDSGTVHFAHKFTVLMSATGEATYLYVYKYDSKIGRYPLEILYKEKIEPGILSFINNPEEVSKIFEPSLEKARSKITEDKWQITPIVFKVMEELWLEPSVAFNNIFFHLRRVFANSKFYFKRDWVGILHFEDEVYFNWYLTNAHDAGRMDVDVEEDEEEYKEDEEEYKEDEEEYKEDEEEYKEDKEPMFKPILYVTNSATQIGFEKTKNNSVKKNSVDNLTPFFTQTRNSVYIKSYLGYGLYSARKEILMHNSGLFKNEKEIVEVKSGCIKVTKSFTWDYMGTKYIISQGPTHEDEEKCKNLVLRFINSMKIKKPDEIKTRMIYTRSHIADYAIEFNLARKNFNVITVEDFIKIREIECNNPNENKPFACLDLTFISLLLTTGFELQPTTQLIIANKTKQIELHWTGYYAFQLAAKMSQRNKPSKFFVLMSATGEATYFYVYKSIAKKHVYPLQILHKEKIEPGILSYISNPKEVTKIFEPRLEKARSLIPRRNWETTPITFKAMDELWLEPEVTLNTLFYYLRRVFSKAKFLYEPQSVGFLGNRDEILYSWYFINILLYHYHTQETFERPKTLPVLYITNSATQIGFALSKEKKIMYNDSEYIKHLNTEHKTLLYHKSYLGYGLYSARKEILMHNSGLFYHEKEVLEVSSDCIKVKTSFTWVYMGIKYSISQAPAKNHKKKCEHIVSRFIKSMNIYKPTEIKGKNIYIKSHIADYAVEFGLAHRNFDELKVEDMIKIKKTVCKHPNENKPFACLDLTFITMLLTEGFGLHHHTKLIFIKGLPQKEYSWTAYYAFSLANTNLFTIYPTKLSLYEFRG